MKIKSRTFQAAACAAYAALVGISCLFSSQVANGQCPPPKRRCCPPVQTRSCLPPQVGGSSDVFEPIHGSYGLDDVEAMYEANSYKPLGGFFAKGFTRTLTVMGGFNELSTNNDAGSLDGVFDDTTTGYAVSAAMGRRHSKKLRSEFEFAARGNNLTTSSPASVFLTEADANVNAYSLMKNVFFELDNSSRFTPYGGFGIGLSYVDVDSVVISGGDSVFEIEDDDTVFTYQAIGGVSARITKTTDFVVEYRFLGTTDVELGSIGQELPYLANNLFLGFKLEYLD